MIKVKNKIYLSAQEAGKLINRSTQFVYMFHKEYWDAYKYGQSIFFDKDQLELWMENRLRRMPK